jgi:DNA polymerase-3 subunit epsilon
MSWKDNQWLILDVETTGLKHEEGHRVIEVGYCLVERRQVVRNESWLINPQIQSLHEDITRITGLTLADLMPHPPFKHNLSKLCQLINDAFVLAAYNEPFDRGFFRNEFALCESELPEKPWLDPCIWVKHFDKFQKGKKLTEAAARRNIQVVGAHRAAADAEMAARVMLSMIESLPDELASVLDLQAMWSRQQQADREKYYASKAQAR